MIQFSLFGIPIQVLPLHWVGLALIGGALSINSIEDIPKVLLFMIAGFIAILLHELAHALVGRKLGGGSANITLVILGGYTQSFGGRFSKWNDIIRTAAGPLINIMTGVILLLVYPFVSLYLRNSYSIELNHYPLFIYFISTLGIISLIWGILNLLPIYPLDGGQILKSFLKSHDLAYKISIAVAVILIILNFSTFYMGPFFPILLGYFAYINYKMLNS